MPKILLRIIAVLAGLGILFYLLGRKLSDWEAEVLGDFENGPSLSENSVPHADGQVSELKQIKGIGPVIEDKLNGIGFYSLQQIANLTKEEENRIEEELNFPGRVERDQWVEQAKALVG